MYTNLTKQIYTNLWIRIAKTITSGDKKTHVIRRLMRHHRYWSFILYSVSDYYYDQSGRKRRKIERTLIKVEAILQVYRCELGFREAPQYLSLWSFHLTWLYVYVFILLLCVNELTQEQLIKKTPPPPPSSYQEKFIGLWFLYSVFVCCVPTDTTCWWCITSNIKFRSTKHRF